jgi:glutathione reductase (NADPH)
MTGKGITGDLRINWQELMAFKHTFTEPVPRQTEENLHEVGIATYHGVAHFTGSSTLEVGADSLAADYIVIATGAKPRPLNIPGAEHIITSTDFLELEDLPQRLVFIGGGYISFEFAHIAARAGADVTIVHRGQRPLENFDADLVQTLVTASEALGIHILTQTEAQSVEKAGNAFTVHTNQQTTLEADLVVHGAGRVPEIDALDLEAAGIQRTKRGVVVNEYLQSPSNPAIYAAGDSADAGGMPLTPVAVSEGHIVGSNIVNGNHRTTNHTGIPSVVFTIPELAKVGLTEAEAKDRGLDFTVKQRDMTDWYNLRRTNEQYAAFKTIVEKETGHILGAHICSVDAGEVINVFALAIQHGITAPELRRASYAYPTAASDVPFMV